MQKLFRPQFFNKTIKNIDNVNNSYINNAIIPNKNNMLIPNINNNNNNKNYNRIQKLFVDFHKRKRNTNHISKTINKPQYISINKSDSIAKSLGFKDTTDFEKFIKDINPYTLNTNEMKKTSKLYKHLSNIAKQNPKSVAKLAIVGGSITAMIIYLKKYQNTYSGCFRYKKGNIISNVLINDDKIKYKFAGKTWCNTTEKYSNSDSNSSSSSSIIKLLPENEHPLFNKIKWDCNYNNFEKGNKKIDNILNLGCNGLCDWRNFNVLAKTTNGEYKPINDINLQQNNYIYKCETISILQALGMSTSSLLGDLFSINLGIDMKYLIIIILIICILYKIYFTMKYKKKISLS